MNDYIAQIMSSDQLEESYVLFQLYPYLYIREELLLISKNPLKLGNPEPHSGK